jgi:hypothetical protein
MNRALRALLPSLAAWALAACAAQISTGPASAGGREVAVVSRVDAAIVPFRYEDGVVAGLGVRLDHVDAPVRAQAGVVRGGYHWHLANSNSFESAIEFGFGEPARIDLDGRGYYTGLSFNFLARMVAQKKTREVIEATNRYNLYAIYWELLFGVDAGVWTMPAALGAQQYFECTFRFGLRFNVGTDVIRNFPPTRGER